jgi:hypothetical protein
MLSTVLISLSRRSLGVSKLVGEDRTHCREGQVLVALVFKRRAGCSQVDDVHVD